jgi:hypothetical protein
MQELTLKASKGTLGVANTSIVEFPRPSKGKNAKWEQEDELRAIDHQASEVEEYAEQNGFEDARPWARWALADRDGVDRRVGGHARRGGRTGRW